MEKNCSRLIVGVISLLLLLTVIRFAAAGSNLVCIVVQYQLYTQIENSINCYLEDLEKEGFNTELRLFEDGSPEDVRAILKNCLLGLVGAVLIGDIPGAPCEVWLWEDNKSTYFQFPSDQFYMDLDGGFQDTDSNGKYDLRTGDRSPEIWVGRIKTNNMSESEVSLVERYFQKNHNYRIGALKLPERALVYVDDDWSMLNNSIAVDVNLAIQDTMVVYENETTTAENYLSYLSQNWSLVHLMAHGSSTMQAFQTNAGADIIDYKNISTANSCFFNLFSCSNGDYTVKDYLGGWYIFSDNYGLAVVCSTAPGGMWFLSDFYRPFQNNTLGFSFREWLAKRIAYHDQYPDWWYNETWYNGMTILGDPTLTLRRTEIPQPGIILGDVNGDGTVGILDLAEIARVFRKAKGIEGFDSGCDLNNDGIIDIFDLAIVACNFGKSTSTS